MLLDVIQTEKKEYISNIIDKSKGVDEIYIYGAGKIAKIIADILFKNKISFTGFCVTDLKKNVTKYVGMPVVSLDEISGKNVLFLLGVSCSKAKPIMDLLNMKGYTNYVDVPRFVTYFDEKKYKECHAPEMEITVRVGCRVNCKYCPQEVLLNQYDGEKIMSFDVFKKCIDKLPNETTIIFSGFCEPFLNDECVEMIIYASEKQYKIKLFTTLEGLDIEKFDRIKNLDFEEVVLHLPDENRYANITVNQEYIELLEYFIETKKSNRESFVSYANSQFEVEHSLKKLINGRVRITGEMIDRAGYLEDEILHSQKLDSRRKRFCSRAVNLNHNVLLPNGDVVLCCMDFGLKHRFGNLLEQTYEEVINSKERSLIIECLSGTQKESILCDNCTSTSYY